MTEFININLPNVVRHLPAVAKSQEEYEKMQKETSELEKNNDKEKNNNEEPTPPTPTPTPLPDETKWLAELERNKSGKILATADNVSLIFENDPKLKDLFFFDTLKGAICFSWAPYWDTDKVEGESITDVMTFTLELILEDPYRIEEKN